MGEDREENGEEESKRSATGHEQQQSQEQEQKGQASKGRQSQQSRMAEFMKRSELNRPSDSVEIIVDVRENRSLIDRLKSFGANITIKQISVGDFILSDRTIIERKTRADFEASIIDGRLFEQAGRLSEFEKPIIVIEGQDGDGAISYCYHSLRINQKAFLGALISLIIDFGVQVLFTKNENETAEMIFAIARREQMEKERPVRFLEKKKALTSEQQQLRILQAFSGIGPQTAKKLLENFHSLDSIFAANEKDLAKLIGNAKAKKMSEILRRKY